MCWSFEASAIVTAIGVGATGWAAARKEPPALWVTLGYFTLMEGLQMASYPVIDACGAPSNQALTMLSFVHICFQPFFINLISMHFVPAGVRRRVAPAVYGLCGLSAAIMLAQAFSLNSFQPCVPGTVLCGATWCTFMGNWHIAWSVPYHSLGFLDQFPTYIVVGFVLPILYGSWRLTLFHIVCGPLAAILSTRNPNEWPAVWCLYSVGLIIIMVMTPLRRHLAVRRWFWPTGWSEATA